MNLLLRPINPVRGKLRPLRRAMRQLADELAYDDEDIVPIVIAISESGRK